MKKEISKGRLYILPSVLGVLTFFIVPFVISLYYTFTKGTVNIKFVGIENFVELLSNEPFHLSVQNTFTFIVIAVPLLIFLSLLISVKLGEVMPQYIRYILLSPMVIPAASFAMGWEIIFRKAGVLNKIFQYVGFEGVDFLGEKYAMAVFILIFIVKNLGYMSVIFTSAISSLPKEYKEVFALDSLSELKYALKVVVPNIIPIIFFASVLAVVNSFQIFREIYIIYGDRPPLSLYTLQYFMNNNFFNLNYQRLSTAAFLVIFAISILIAIYMRQRRVKNEK